MFITSAMFFASGYFDVPVLSFLSINTGLYPAFSAFSKFDTESSMKNVNRRSDYFSCIPSNKPITGFWICKHTAIIKYKCRYHVSFLKILLRIVHPDFTIAILKRQS